MYEILVFEHNSLYDYCTRGTSDTALHVFVEMCREFVNPEYVLENETSFDSGSLFMSYADRSGNDKPMLVLLIGTITEDMIALAGSELKKLYNRMCEDCNNVEIPITTRVCRECANL